MTERLGPGLFVFGSPVAFAASLLARRAADRVLAHRAFVLSALEVLGAAAYLVWNWIW
ncbi:MAG: hypothetical protein HY763_17440 [Planctomycetes bacterium]|nr:hypothetical protein [Planctomycetota bacterium]